MNENFSYYSIGNRHVQIVEETSGRWERTGRVQELTETLHFPSRGPTFTLHSSKMVEAHSIDHLLSKAIHIRSLGEAQVMGHELGAGLQLQIRHEIWLEGVQT